MNVQFTTGNLTAAAQLAQEFGADALRQRLADADQQQACIGQGGMAWAPPGGWPAREDPADLRRGLAIRYLAEQHSSAHLANVASSLGDTVLGAECGDPWLVHSAAYLLENLRAAVQVRRKLDG